MITRTIQELMHQHPFFSDFPAAVIELMASCGRNRHYQAGSFLAREGDAADHFFVVRSGQIALEVHGPALEPYVVQTLHDGDIAGWSWIFEPHIWQFDLRAQENTSVIALDGSCLREKCERDHHVGYLLMKRFARVLTENLRATRLQLLQVYGR